MTRLLLLALPFGTVLYAASFLLRCRHRTELPSLHADGSRWLRCPSCGHERPNMMQVTVAPKFKRVLPSKAEQERRDVETALTQIERRSRFELISGRTVAKFGGGR